MNELGSHPAVELVWNKGIAARCDRRIPNEFPNGRDYSPVLPWPGDWRLQDFPTI